MPVGKNPWTSIEIVLISAQSQSNFQLCHDLLLEISVLGPGCSLDDIPLSIATSETAETSFYLADQK